MNNVIIGSYNKIESAVYISSYVTIGSENTFREKAHLGQYCSLGDYNFIDYVVKIGIAARIWSYCVLNTRSIVPPESSVPDRFVLKAHKIYKQPKDKSDKI